jgi:hypothetical protein
VEPEKSFILMESEFRFLTDAVRRAISVCEHSAMAAERALHSFDMEKRVLRAALESLEDTVKRK